MPHWDATETVMLPRIRFRVRPHREVGPLCMGVLQVGGAGTWIAKDAKCTKDTKGAGAFRVFRTFRGYRVPNTFAPIMKQVPPCVT